MSNRKFIADLSSTEANIRKLDAKKINLKGKDILDYIKDATPTIKHSQDTRETVTENDLWGQWVETKEDGTAIVHDDWVTNPNASNYRPWDSSITNVEDNKAYTSSGFYANIQTEKIKDGERLFFDCKNFTSFASDLSSLTDGFGMFYNCSNLTSFTSDSNGSPMNLSNLSNGGCMFIKCSNLTSFTSDLPSLTDGSEMFNGCEKFTSFNSDLHILTVGDKMFYNCSQLTSFTSDLPSLTYGGYMFHKCSALTSFSSDLSSLISGYYMFQSCSALTSFNSDLSNMMNGGSMFENCSVLTSFTSDLSSLTNGSNMFSSCILDAKSVMYIAYTIKNITAEKQLYIDGTIPYVTKTNNVYSAYKGFMSDGKYVYSYKNPQPTTTTISASNVGKLSLGINVTNDADTIQQQLEDFAKEATFNSWADLKQNFVDKGWTVIFQYGGTSDSITYGLRGGERIIPCPIFAKLVQVEDKDSADYCTEDASTFYDIEWGHDVTDTSSYTQFDSLEDAMASWKVFPKENIITSEE